MNKPKQCKDCKHKYHYTCYWCKYHFKFEKESKKALKQYYRNIEMRFLRAFKKAGNEVKNEKGE